MKETKTIAYKGFDENLCCQGFQYEVGKEYEHEGEIVCCCSGFHACLNPFDVLEYYENNGKNRYCVVEQSGVIDSDSNDTKQSSSKIRIIAEIGINNLFKAGIEWIKEKINPDAIIKSLEYKVNVQNLNFAQIDSNDYSAKIGTSGASSMISSSGDYAKIFSSGAYNQFFSSGLNAKIGLRGFSDKIVSIGDSAQIGTSGNFAWIGSSGCCAQIGARGYCAHIVSSGTSDKIVSSGYSDKIVSSGSRAHIVSIDKYANIASIGYSANIASSGDSAQIVSSGSHTKIFSSGKSARICLSGNYVSIASTGKDSVICCAGGNSVAKAKRGSWITLSEWKYSEEQKRDIPVCVKTEFVDGERIKADTWYKLVDGEFKEQ